MDQLIEFLNKQHPDPGLIIFLMVMSFFVAIFHTLIFAALLNFNFNKKLFFILNPLSIGVCALIDFRLGLAVFLLLFSSVFILAPVGMFAIGIRSRAENKKEIENFYRQYKQTPPSTGGKSMLSILFLVCICIGFFYVGFKIIPLVAILIVALVIFSSSNKSRFLKYQTILPVSKIRSLAMGLVAIEGKVKMLESLKSPVSGKDCIGFSYSIETITRDDNGSDSYTTHFSTTVCNEFMIDDGTGSIKINPAGLELIWVKNESQERRNDKRYTENLLKEGDNVRLMGRASVDANNSQVIEYDSFRKVLALAPVTELTNFKNNKPFRHSFIFFSAIYCVLIACVLITPIEIDSNTIIIKKPDWTLFHF